MQTEGKNGGGLGTRLSSLHISCQSDIYNIMVKHTEDVLPAMMTIAAFTRIVLKPVPKPVSIKLV